MERNMTRLRSALAACLAATAIWMAPAAFAQDAPRAQGGPAVNFVNGGVTQEEADQLRARASSFPVEIQFARRMDGASAFAAEVHVRIVDASGNFVLVLPAAEPILLANLPPGRYTVEATYEGQTQRQQLTVGRGHQKLGFEFGGEK
jgi:hypothetical protein